MDKVHPDIKKLWRQTLVKLAPLTVLMLIGAVLTSGVGDIQNGNFSRKAISIIGIFIFMIFASASLHVITSGVRKIITYRLGTGRAATIQFTLRTIGYLIIILVTLDLLGIPLGKLLVGGAVIGIILGVAAQQALANFFASIVLIISHPFQVGDYVTLNSGALGGEYVGEITDLGLTHTKLQTKEGSIVHLPNATLLSGSAITPHQTKK
jgi:small-conductance mechanosensitive channel